VSEVSLHMWRNVGKFEGRSQASTWLLGVARHRALEALRRHTTGPLTPDAAALVADPVDDPETMVGRLRTSAILRNCLTQLSPLHREIIDLIYYHGKTISNAAEIIGVPQNTVKTRMFHARKRLAALLRPHGITSAST
jgi:RNA polymerase sigma-70 factor (ECF subfamily)